MSRPTPDRYTFVGEVLTGDPSRPRAASLTIDDGVVVGFDERPSHPDTTVSLPVGEHLQPGFRDDHLHLLATAAVGLSVDVSGCATNAEVVSALQEARPSANGWVRAWGYDESLISTTTLSAEDLSVLEHPLVLHHRTGHVAILNPAAMRELGLGDRGDGVLIDRHDLLAGVPRLSEADVTRAVGQALERLLRAGITAVTDATHTNDRAALEFLDRARPWRGPVITAMVGADRLGDLEYGDEVGGVSVGHAKVMADGDPARVRELVHGAHRRGFPAAVHVMDVETLALTLDAFAASPPPAGTQDRIEHCALALPEQLDEVARLDVHVATQPSFVVDRVAKYRDELTPTEQEWLWPLRSLLERGVSVSFSSDAPVVAPAPVAWIEAAARRPIGRGEAIEVDRARQLALDDPLRIGTDIAQMVRLDAAGRSRPLLN